MRLVFAELETYAGGGANGGNGSNGGGSGGSGGVGGKGKSRRMSRLGGARGSRAVTRKKAADGAGRRRSTVVAMKATVQVCLLNISVYSTIQSIFSVNVSLN